jgi:hypothetical protein
MLHLADAALVAGLVAGIWYLPNVANLKDYFFENAKVGALEGEPQVLSFQSFIYYLRLLEGYQVFALLFVIVTLSVFFVWRKRLLRDAGFIAAAVCGGWLAMTLLRTKDPRFTMPLLGPLLVVPGAWLQSWHAGWRSRTVEAILILALAFQAYTANFGIRWLPQELVLARGYAGSFEWNWNVYLQHYFHVLGAPRRENWKLDEILSKVADDGRSRGGTQKLALIADLPRFNAVNFTLMARLRGYPVQVGHLRAEPRGIQAFHGYDYVVMTERDQGMSWTTSSSRLLNQTIVDAPRTFRLLGCYVLPAGDTARLYFIQRSVAEVRQ